MFFPLNTLVVICGNTPQVVAIHSSNIIVVAFLTPLGSNISFFLLWERTSIMTAQTNQTMRPSHAPNSCTMGNRNPTNVESKYMLEILQAVGNETWLRRHKHKTVSLYGLVQQNHIIIPLARGFAQAQPWMHPSGHKCKDITTRELHKLDFYGDMGNEMAPWSVSGSAKELSQVTTTGGFLSRFG